MFNLKFIGLALVAGAAGGVYLTGLAKEKLGIGNGDSKFKNADKSKVEIVRIPKGEKLAGVKVFLQETEDAKDSTSTK